MSGTTCLQINRLRERQEPAPKIQRQFGVSPTRCPQQHGFILRIWKGRVRAGCEENKKIFGVENNFEMFVLAACKYSVGPGLRRGHTAKWGLVDGVKSQMKCVVCKTAGPGLQLDPSTTRRTASLRMCRDSLLLLLHFHLLLSHLAVDLIAGGVYRHCQRLQSLGGQF
jgi:hypothetical protein